MAKDGPLAGRLSGKFHLDHPLWPLVKGTRGVCQRKFIKLPCQITIRFDSDPKFAAREFSFDKGDELHRLPNLARTVSRYFLRSANHKSFLHFDISGGSIWFMGTSQYRR